MATLISQIITLQVRSECLTCTFRARCCNARLSRAHVPAFADSSVRDRGKKGEGVRKDRLHWRVQDSTSSPTVVGSRRRVFEVLWNLECPVGLSQREIGVHFNDRNLAQFGRSAENPPPVELRGVFEFSRPTVAQLGPIRC